MSSTKSRDSSRGMKSQSIPQGAFRPDPMFAMHQAKPKTTQSPEKTMRQLQTILNPPDCFCASMTEKQAKRSQDC